jgi:hypothetical protein
MFRKLQLSLEKKQKLIVHLKEKEIVQQKKNRVNIYLYSHTAKYNGTEKNNNIKQSLLRKLCIFIKHINKVFCTPGLPTVVP